MMDDIKITSSPSKNKVYEFINDTKNYNYEIQDLIDVLGPYYDNSEVYSDDSLSFSVKQFIMQIIGQNNLNSLDVLQSVIINHVKPYFTSKQAKINEESGRPRIKSLASEVTDNVDVPAWKSQKYGVWGTLLLLMDLVNVNKCWFMFLPPTISLLDDYDPFYKIKGVNLAHKLLLCLEPKVIEQANLSALFEGSFSTTLSHFSHERGSQALQSAVPATLTLIKKSINDDERRIEAYYKLTTESVIQPWFFAGEKLNVLHSTFTILPSLLQSLGIYSVRFLKAIIPQIKRTLVIASPPTQHSIPIQLASLNSLIILMDVCEPRIKPRRIQILDCLVKTAINTPNNNQNKQFIQYLQECFKKLTSICPEVNIEFDKLQNLSDINIGILRL